MPDFTLHSIDARIDHWELAKREWQLPVLRARTWLMMAWPDFDDEIARFERSTQGDSHDYVVALGAWGRALRERLPEIVGAARTTAQQLLTDAGADGFTTRARQQAVGPLLFQAGSGRLDLAAIRRACPTPARTLELARNLGVPVDDPPTR